MLNHRRQPAYRWPVAVAVAVVAGVSAVAVSAGQAAAVPAVPPNQAFVPSAVNATYPLSANRAAWSIAATQGIGGGQSDLDISLPGGPVLARSAEGFGVLDWVAVNTNPGRLPAGRFDVRVTADTGGGRPTTHSVQLVAGGPALVPGRATVVGSADRPWLVDIRDLRLHAGEMVSLRVNSAVGAVSVVDDDPKPIFWQQNPVYAMMTVAAPEPDTADHTFTVDFTAAEDGDYGVVFAARTPESRGASVTATIVG
jgi:hypothetical protein